MKRMLYFRTRRKKKRMTSLDMTPSPPEGASGHAVLQVKGHLEVRGHSVIPILPVVAIRLAGEHKILSIHLKYLNNFLVEDSAVVAAVGHKNIAKHMNW